MSGLVVVTDNLVKCISFNDELGNEQLMCLLHGEKTTFKISCDSSGQCEITKQKIRFVSSAFKTDLETIRHSQTKLRDLCQLLVREIRDGQVIVETKKQDKVYAVTSELLAAQLKEGRLTPKTYAHIESKDNTFFEKIAEAFEESLEEILAQTETFNKEALQKTPLDKIKQEQDVRILAPQPSNWSLFGMVRRMVASICERFGQATSKITEQMVKDSREQARISHEKQAQDRKEKRRLRADERRLEALKQDNALILRKIDNGQLVK